MGGLTAARAAHDRAQQAGIPVWCGGMHEFGIGRAANVALSSLPGFTLPSDVSASEKYYARDVITPPVSRRPRRRTGAQGNRSRPCRRHRADRGEHRRHAVPLDQNRSGSMRTALTGGLVVDGTGAEPVAATVLIDGGRITGVLPAGAELPGARGDRCHGQHCGAGLHRPALACGLLAGGQPGRAPPSCTRASPPWSPGTAAGRRSRSPTSTRCRAGTAFLAPEHDWSWQDSEGFADVLVERAARGELALQVGHSALRLAVLGGAERAPSAGRVAADARPAAGGRRSGSGRVLDRPDLRAGHLRRGGRSGRAGGDRGGVRAALLDAHPQRGRPPARGARRGDRRPPGPVAPGWRSPT